MKYAITDQTILKPIPIHGSTPESLNELLNAYALNNIIKLLSIKTENKITDPNYDLLISILSNSDVQEIAEMFQSPYLNAWLNRFYKILSLDQDGIETHLKYIPLLFLKYLFGHSLSYLECVVPGNAEYSPINTNWKIIPVGNKPINTIFNITSTREIEIKHLNFRPVTIKQTDLSANENPGWLNNDFIEISNRNMFLDNKLELLDYDSFPELSAMRLKEEYPSSLKINELEIEFKKSFDLIAEVWPYCINDVNFFFKGLLPMSMPEGRWNSASTNELPFILQLTVRPGGWPFLLAESMIHEISHVKLDLIKSITPLLKHDTEKIFKHPWRPDLRPISGVLLGAHAFLAVMKFYEIAYKKWPTNTSIEYEVTTRRNEVGIALDILEKNADFTQDGRLIFESMKENYYN